MPFKLTILGSSSALPTVERNLTAHLLTANERYYLIDCGEGTQIQLRRAGIKFGKLSHIFISHLHGDHFYGLIGLISTYSLLGLKNDLHIYAHSELQRLIQPLLDNVKAEKQFKIVFHPLNFRKPQLIHNDKNFEVTSFPLKHSIPVCGFLFREKQKPGNLIREMLEEYRIPISQRQAIKNGSDFIADDGTIILNRYLVTPAKKPCSYAFCTDTAYYEPVTEIIKEVDLLYHEATFLTDNQKMADQTLHSTAAQAASIAKKANVGKLIIGHFSNRYKNTDLFGAEAGIIFPQTRAVNDGDVFHITNQ
jgi:ribonuclease Z